MGVQRRGSGSVDLDDTRGTVYRPPRQVKGAHELPRETVWTDSSPGVAIPQAVADLTWTPLGDTAGLAEKTAEQLAQAIITGKLAGGTKLIEPEIGAAFGISRTPVREALYILQRDGLIERSPRKEARVSHVTAKQAFDVYVCRAYLYGLSAKIAAAIIDDTTLAELEEIVCQMDSAVSNADEHEYFRLNLRFHDIIGITTGNEMLYRLMGAMGGLTLRFRYMSITIPGRMALSAKRHRRLLELLRERNGRAAELEVRAIVSSAGDAVLAHFFNDHSGGVTAATLEL
jgi:DNA-binding GntR family transcriptional regulator